MIDTIRNQIIRYLAENATAIISTAGQDGAWSMPAPYRAHGLQVECLLPGWSATLYHLEADPRVVLVVPQEGGVWLQYCGKAEVLDAPDWSAWAAELGRAGGLRELYRVVRLVARRIEMFDDRYGWGARETLDL